VTLVGETVHDVLLVIKLTKPVKPLTAATVTVEVPGALALTVTEVGLAAMAKSCTTKVTITEWDREPLAPVTNTCLVPVEVNVHDNVALPEPVKLAGETVHDAVVLVARLTTPAKPLTADIVMVDVPAAFTFTLTLVGLAVIVKSWTTNVTVTV